MQKKPSQRKQLIVGSLYIGLKRKSNFGYPGQGPAGTRGRHRSVSEIPTRTIRIPSGDPRATQGIPKGYPRDQQARNTGATRSHHPCNTVAGRCCPPIDATPSESDVSLPVRKPRKCGKPVLLVIKVARQPGRIAG